MYESGIAVTPLYDGADTTVLQALVKHFLWFSTHPGISKDALSDVLKMEHDLLPHLPASYDDAVKMLSPYISLPCLSK